MYIQQKMSKQNLFFKGYDFLGAPGNLHGHPGSSYAIGKNKNNKQRLLLCIIGPIESRNHKKRAMFIKEKIHFFVRQCTSSQIDKNDGKINELRFELFPHLPYSPDLAPSDFYLFPNFKKWLRDKDFH